jgi:hypothetical protein
MSRTKHTNLSTRTTIVIVAAVTAATVAVTGALASTNYSAAPPTSQGTELPDGFVSVGEAGLSLVSQLRMVTESLDAECPSWRDGETANGGDQPCASHLDELDRIERTMMGVDSDADAGPRSVATPTDVYGP